MDLVCPAIGNSTKGASAGGWQKAVSLYNKDDYDGAAEVLERIISKNPKNITAYQCLAASYYQGGKNKLAIQTLQRMVSIAPEPENYFRLGLLYFENKENDQALKSFEQSVRLDPANLKYRKQLSYVLFVVATSLELTPKNQLRIVDMLERAIRYNPGNEEAYEKLAETYEKMAEQKVGKEKKQSLEKAEKVYIEALKINPKSKAALSLANLSLSLDRIDLAKQYLKKYLDVNPEGFAQTVEVLKRLVVKYPKDVEGHKLLAVAYQNTGRTHLAIEEYKQIVTLEPKSADNYYLLGVLFASKGMDQEAIGHLEQAVRLEPSNVKYKNFLSGIYFARAFILFSSLNINKKNWEKTIDDLERAINLNPMNVEARWLLGQVFEEIATVWENRKVDIHAIFYYKAIAEQYLAILEFNPKPGLEVISKLVKVGGKLKQYYDKNRDPSIAELLNKIEIKTKGRTDK